MSLLRVLVRNLSDVLGPVFLGGGKVNAMLVED